MGSKVTSSSRRRAAISLLLVALLALAVTPVMAVTTPARAQDSGIIHVFARVVGGHGSVSPGTQWVWPSQSATIRITPDPGYRISSIVDNGDKKKISNPYVIKHVWEPHWVYVTFERCTYTVTAGVQGGHGTVTPREWTGHYGDTARVYSHPDTGYHVATITDNGVSKPVADPYVISNISADHEVVVTFSLNQYTVNAAVDGGHGSVDPPTQNVNAGGTASIDITPDTGYGIATIVDNGASRPIADPYVIENVQADHDVVVTFGRLRYTVDASVDGGHGAVDPASQTVVYGGTATVYITPDSGYHVASITDNGTAVPVADPYVIENVAADHDVVVTFSSDEYPVNAAVVGGHGTVDPETQTVADGGTASIEITPDTGYEIFRIIDNGAFVTPTSPYVINNVHEQHNVVVVFRIREFTVTATDAGGHGTVDPTSQTVEYGHTASIDIIPDPGYHVASITDNGSGVPVADPYVIENVVIDHIVVVTFAADEHEVRAEVFGGHGSVNPASQTVNEGGNASINIDPDTGYEIAAIIDNGAHVTISNPYVINNVTADHDVVVIFKIHSLSVTASAAGGGGTVDPTSQTVEYGHAASIDIIPDPGYHVASITDNGSGVPVADPYVIENVVINHIVVVTFALNQYTVDASVVGGHGLVNPAGQDVLHGGTASININPDPGYEIATITDNGVPAAESNPYVINNVTEDHDVVVTFKASDFMVVALAPGGHGTVSPATQIVTLHNDSTPIVITPAAGYHIETVTDNGVSKPAASPYQVLDVTDDHAVIVTFAPDEHRVDASVVGGHGSVAPSSQTVIQGGTASIEITPDEGYETAAIIDNGAHVPVSNPYVINNVTADHDVVVLFRIRRFVVNAAVGGGTGTVDPPSQTVQYGHAASIDITPGAGFHAATIIDNSSSVPVSDPYVIENVTALHNVVVSFAADEHRVDASVAGGHGSVAPSSQTVIQGGTASIGITPDEGYETAAIIDNGAHVPVSNPYVINNVTADHDVTVVFSIREFTVTASVAGGNGTVDPDTQVIDYGHAASIDITANPGYHIASITDTGTPVPVSDPYVIKSVTSVHDVVVTFTNDTYPVDAEVSGGHGTAVPVTQTVASGAQATIVLTPVEGYEVASITDNGRAMPLTETYVIPSVTEEHDVVVTFSIRDFTVIAAAAGPGGSVSPATQTVAYGGRAVVDITPQAGYEIASITDTGTPMPVADPYVIDSVTSNHDVVVSFALDDYTVNAVVVGGHGSVQPGTQTVTAFGTAAVNIVADAGYHVAGISDNGEPAPVSNPFVINNIVEDHEVVVTFSIDEYTAKARVAGGHGAVDPVEQQVAYGDTATIILEPDGGYHAALIVDNGQQKPVENPYFINDVTQDHNVTVAYEYNQSPVFYLAEGSTDWGFSTYLCIMNPTTEPVNARLTYMVADGTTTEQVVGLPALSQVTVNPADTLGPADFSTKVECLQGSTIAVDRTISWTGPGAPSPEGHCSIGVAAPRNTWLLPEGCSGYGFETWTLVQNPNDRSAQVTLTYMIEGKGPREVNLLLPAHSRSTNSMLADIGPENASIQVRSDVPVIAERSMYRNNRREGSCSIGAEAPSDGFYLAEGSTAWGFTTYVLVQNPNLEEAEVNVKCMTTNGPTMLEPFTMPPQTRATLCMNDLVPDVDFSTEVTADVPIVAERAMYWGAGTPLGEACHDSIGLDEPHAVFYLPDGQTVNGRETYTLVANPNDTDVKVMVNYVFADGSGANYIIATIPANSRATFDMSDQLPSGNAAIEVKCLTGGKKVLAERAMYWNNRGAGSETVGDWSH